MNTIHGNAINGLPENHEVESRARAIFRNACENADSYHTLRLGLARRKAVNAGAARSRVRIWAPLAGTVACCALVAGVLWMRPAARVAPTANIVASSTPIASGQQAESEDLTPELGSSQTEMVQDLDFYRWLASQPAVASARNGGAR